MGVASATARSALTTDALCALQAERNRLTEKLSAQALAHTREREAWHAQTQKLREQLDEHERGAAAFAAERRNMEKMMLAHTRERESWHSQTLALRTQLSEALRGAVPKSLASSNGGPPAPPIRGAMPLSAARDEAEMPIHVSKPARAPAEMPVPQRQGRPSATSGSGGEPHSSPGASSDEPPVDQRVNERGGDDAMVCARATRISSSVHKQPVIGERALVAAAHCCCDDVTVVMGAMRRVRAQKRLHEGSGLHRRLALSLFTPRSSQLGVAAISLRDHELGLPRLSRATCHPNNLMRLASGTRLARTYATLAICACAQPSKPSLICSLLAR